MQFANVNVGIVFDSPDGMGESRKRVVVEAFDGNDRIAIHPVTYAALSYDRRIVDDVTANVFLGRVTEILEKAAFGF